MIPLFKPVYNTERILADLRMVFNSGWTGMGKKVEEFESAVCKYLGVKHCIATNSCTSALHLALHALNLKRGAKVLATPLTFVSTNHVILYEGLKPVFYDIRDTMTGEPDFHQLYIHCQKDRPGAIIVVHYGGYPTHPAIYNICSRLDLPLIEDCAHAFGASQFNLKIGNPPDTAWRQPTCCFSFHAVKNLSAGDGGAITTNDDEMAKRLRSLRWMGIDRTTAERTGTFYSWEYNVGEVGYKAHMNDITATVALRNLELVDEQNLQRNLIASFYRDNLKNAIFPQYKYEDRLSSYHIYPVFVEDRNAMADKLTKAGISCGVHYKLNCDYLMYRRFKRLNDCKNARWFSEHEITLPMTPALTDENLEYIAEVWNR